MDEIDEEFDRNKITISVRNRTGRKLATHVYGFGEEFDLEKILKHWQKKFHCTGSIEKSDKFGDVIKLTGNHKMPIFDFLVQEEICKKTDVVLKGI
jgi:translation initiation factor SUI1